jgi:putative Mg2+ transporter-C (MgtC) family protein
MLPELGLGDGLLRLVVAALLAGVIGLERENAEQEAGLRTHMLVSVGSCLFMIVGVYGWEGFHFSNNAGIIVDPSRVASYVVAGIGFLGGGAIIRQGVNVKGLTTAASIWVVAAIGVAVGIGMYEFAAATTALVLVSLWPLKILADQLGLRRGATVRVQLELHPQGDVAPILSAVERHRIDLESIKIDEEADVRRVDLVLDARRRDVAGLVDEISQLEHVRSEKWPA